MKCLNCDADLVEDAQFCVECGAAVENATTGPTVRLPKAAGGPVCTACGILNPAEAQFCVNCGRRLEISKAAQLESRRGAAAVAEHPVMPSLPPMPELPVQSQPVRMPSTPVAHLAAGYPAQKKHCHTGRGGGIIGGVFLIGLAVLFMTGLFWPGILALLGVCGFLSNIAEGKPREGLMPLVFMTGLAVLFMTGLFWPGILVLVGVTAMLGALLRI
ncbi:MAG: zinc ribbon domain-containing protein [Chloroflexales bacterium]|nr:zinc ribbon domain-containing protein [Chloroflexales bacterium]